MLDFMKPSKPRKNLVPEELIPNRYFQRKVGVFISLYLAYAGYYIIRADFKIASPYLIEQFGFTKTDIGGILAAYAIVYGFAKFFMGALCDKANSHYYITLGLVLSAVLNLSFAGTKSIPVFYALMLFMAVTQSMGGPAVSKILSAWFAKYERGTYMSIWNTSHNAGAALAAPIAITLGFALMGAGNIKAIFIVPTVVSLVLAVIVFVTGAENPQSVGLPTIEEYKPEASDVSAKDDYHTELTFFEIFKKYFLTNKYVWFLVLANGFVYMVRYGVSDWIPIYLSEGKGFTKEEAGYMFSFFELIAIPGTILIGFISDKLFKAKRVPLAIGCMALLIIAVFAYWQTADKTMIIVLIGLMGILVYGPQMLIAVLTLDMVPRFAIGALVGFVGLFGYVLGEMGASLVVGILSDTFGWGGVFVFIIVGTIIGLFCFVGLLKFENDELDKKKKIQDDQKADKNAPAKADSAKKAPAKSSTAKKAPVKKAPAKKK
ncbi:MAG: MFS transporter [Bifidobacteriaceae bacterium]|jgi:OPA family glycerol-3-phosphate transporter-like MFS transporter|nr:MFS transporter [Bifidobacteriaceae bacterium]